MGGVCRQRLKFTVRSLGFCTGNCGSLFVPVEQERDEAGAGPALCTVWVRCRCVVVITLLLLSLFSRSVVYDSLQTHGLQHARLPCPSPVPTPSLLKHIH